MERINASEAKYRSGDSGPKYIMRGPLHEWGVIRLLPGQKAGQHFHQEVEETFYFPQGAPLIVINGEGLRVHPGDAFRLQPSDKHDIVNDTADPVEFIFIKCPYLPDDKVTF